MKLDHNVTVYFNSKGGCTVAGATAETALDVMADYARYYLTESDGPHYASVDVEISRACDACEGRGRKLKPRCKQTYVDCKACEGGAYVNVTGRVRLFRLVTLEPVEREFPFRQRHSILVHQETPEAWIGNPIGFDCDPSTFPKFAWREAS